MLYMSKASLTEKSNQESLTVVTRLYLQGMGKLRSSLREVLANEPGVVITGPKMGAGQADLDDNAVDSTAAAMRRSKFCLVSRVYFWQSF